MDYTPTVLEVRQSETFARWLGKLKDRQAVAKINARIRRLSVSGGFGDAKALREGISEMRIDYGPGYRLYFMRRGAVMVVLLAGGDKRTQEADIKRAIEVSKAWKE
jgi:putative addiction module killer protein